MWDRRSSSTLAGRALPRARFGLLGLLLGLAAILTGPGCSSRAPEPSLVHDATYAIPDDFRLVLMRIERQLEAGNMEGFLRTFDMTNFPHFREFERTALDFYRRADQVHWDWIVKDVSENPKYRELLLDWELSFLDLRHQSPIRMRGRTGFQLSHATVPKVIGLSGDPLLPVFP